MMSRFTRRRFLDAGITASAAATTLGHAKTPPSPTDRGQAVSVDDAPAAPAQNMLRRVVERLRSRAGAAMIGFAAPGNAAASGTVQRKLGELLSIVDFGAVADDEADNQAAIQRAIDAVHAAGGGALLIPAGKFRFRSSLFLRPGVKLQGAGTASVLHFINANRGNALCAQGTALTPLTGISLRDFSLWGDARFTRGHPNTINGGGILFTFTDDCDVSGVSVVGFSDAGIAFLNGNRNSVTNCRVDKTAQGICFLANTISITGNLAIANRITDTGEYNGLHLEGGFGGQSKGEVCHTTLSGNTISNSWEAGINIELAPYTSCVGNTVHRSGLAKSSIDMGIKVYGGFRSAICGNTVAGSNGFGIVIGANSGECVVSGNVTAGNGRSLLLTDSGSQVSNDVAIGTNSFAEGDIETAGNIRIRNRVVGMRMMNRNDPDPQTLDWYEEGGFIPTVEEAGVRSTASYTVVEARFTRIGNIVHISTTLVWPLYSGTGLIRIKGLPYAAAASGILMAARQIGLYEEQLSARIAANERRLTLAPVIEAGSPATTGSCTISIAGHYTVAA